LKLNNCVQSINVIKILQANYRTPSVISLSTPSSFSALQKWLTRQGERIADKILVVLLFVIVLIFSTLLLPRTEQNLCFFFLLLWIFILIPISSFFSPSPSSSFHLYTFKLKLLSNIAVLFNLSLFWLFHLHFHYS
jgi:hypothetical protein